ncbi:unnamed protein product, partial [Symbiodinium pilosum]
VQATMARVNAACAAAVAAKQREALEERKNLLGLPPLDEAPWKPAWPSKVVQPRNLQPWSGAQAQGMQASAAVLVQAQPQTLTGMPKPPSGPPPARLQGPPTEPQSGLHGLRGLSAEAPAFQPGHAWQPTRPVLYQASQAEQDYHPAGAQIGPDTSTVSVNSPQPILQRPSRRPRTCPMETV